MSTPTRTTRTSYAELYAAAFRRSVVIRGLKCSLVVGPILVAINQGDVLLSGELGPTLYWKTALTFLVPYWVSVFSSVSAIVNQHDSASEREGSVSSSIDRSTLGQDAVNERD